MSESASLGLYETLRESGDCEGGPCWRNPETGYMEYCQKHEAIVADFVAVIDANVDRTMRPTV